MILHTETKLKPQDIGLAASIDVSITPVYRKLRVGIFFIGDELREARKNLQEGQSYNSNRHTTHGLLKSLNREIIGLGNIREEDYIRLALEEIGQLNLWRIYIKSGKPLVFGLTGKIPSFRNAREPCFCSINTRKLIQLIPFSEFFI